MIYRDENTVYYDTENITRGMWHTDMSHERQPPGLTLVVLFHFSRSLKLTYLYSAFFLFAHRKLWDVSCSHRKCTDYEINMVIV